VINILLMRIVNLRWWYWVLCCNFH